MFEPGEKENWIRLEKDILIEDEVINRESRRSKLALARATEYFKSCGYTIEDDD